MQPKLLDASNSSIEYQNGNDRLYEHICIDTRSNISQDCNKKSFPSFMIFRQVGSISDPVTYLYIGNHLLADRQKTLYFLKTITFNRIFLVQNQEMNVSIVNLLLYQDRRYQKLTWLGKPVHLFINRELRFKNTA